MLHLNMGREHSMTYQNDEWAIGCSRTSSKKERRLVSSRLFGLSSRMRDAEPVELIDTENELIDFVRAYNKAHGLIG